MIILSTSEVFEVSAEIILGKHSIKFYQKLFSTWESASNHADELDAIDGLDGFPADGIIKEVTIKPTSELMISVGRCPVYV